jgi:hypothetical protein
MDERAKVRIFKGWILLGFFGSGMAKPTLVLYCKLCNVLLIVVTTYAETDNKRWQGTATFATLLAAS